MRKRKESVAVAMSGGVDSSVAACLLLESGYEVSGVSLRLWSSNKDDPKNCSNSQEAKKVADFLGIPHTHYDLSSRFASDVAGPFVQGYLRGVTPNPCIACNRDFKFGALLHWAKERGIRYVATGHYARVARDPETGRAFLLRGLHLEKDQSYFLFALSQEQLAHTLFPVGHLRKDEVRQVARRFGLQVADRPESQDVCFGTYKAMVESLASAEELHGGEIVDRSGRVLGRHGGIHRFTVGQRRGLGLSASRPLYVLKVDPSQRRIVVGSKEELGCKGFVLHAVHWIEPQEQEEIAAEVQVRYRSPSVACLVRQSRNGAVAKGPVAVDFCGPAHPVTPGQVAVFYRGERVLGGGWIVEGIPAS